MRTFSFYDIESGLFHAGTFTTGSANARRAARDLAANTPPGCAAIEGRYDRATQRVDIATGAVVAYERPAAELEAEQRAARDRRARQRIEQLERSQARAIRELVLNNDQKARERLAAIDGEIAELRADL